MKLFIGDTAHDSNNIRNKLEDFNLGNINAIRKIMKLFIGDTAHDSNNIRNKLEDFNLGNIIVSKNERH